MPKVEISEHRYRSLLAAEEFCRAARVKRRSDVLTQAWRRCRVTSATRCFIPTTHNPRPCRIPPALG